MQRRLAVAADNKKKQQGKPGVAVLLCWARGAPAVFLLWLGLLASGGCPRSPGAALVVVPAAISPSSGALLPLADGDSIDLVRPIQGGHVLFIGAYVNGASGTSGTIRAELRRSVSDSGQPLSMPGPILVFEERSTMLVPLAAGTTPPSAAPGWQQIAADISEVANIAACPNVLPVDIPDQPLYVQVTYTDSQQGSGTAFVKVVPRCRQPDDASRSQCLCECHANYTIDRCFISRDGGAD
jgi:hypothetical protein